MKEKTNRIAEIALALLFLMWGLAGMPTFISAQNVIRQGNTFTQVVSKPADKETKTMYVFTDSKGSVHPIYLSASGKAFIKKISKKNGKEYKQYLPEVGKQINPEAYKKEKK